MEDHQEEVFKTPSDQFTKELDVLEQYNHATNAQANIARMSLYKQFDPLVAFSKSPVVHQTDVTNNEFDSLPPQTEETIHNNSCTLIHINTPSSKLHYENNSSQNEFNTNGHVNVTEDLDEDNVQEVTTDEVGSLFNEFVLINEQIIDTANDQFHSFQQQLSNCQKEEEKLNSIKNHLEEDLNNVEKNYYDTHSRYENLRSIVKEMDSRESISKEKFLELASKLKEKEQECRKWKQMAEEAQNNQRTQNATNKESISLKAQVKVLEMRVSGLQSQLEQKNRENEELTHIVDELIGKKN